jgi:thiol-disulfide isomerase/thioredoxin
VAPGLIALAAALAVADVTGLVWQRNNGRMRGTPAPGAPAAQAQAHDGLAGLDGPAAPQAGPRLSTADLGGPLGERATLVQFSTAFCAPCRATRRILGEVAGMIDGVAHVEIDAESHLDLVRRLDILRTPTVLVLGPDGRIAKRGSGQPRKADIIAAVGEVPYCVPTDIPSDQIERGGK